MKKSATGFRGKYFSLAGIQALHTQVQLTSVNTSRSSFSYALKILECDAEDPPEEDLLETTLCSNQNQQKGSFPCHCNCYFKKLTRLTLKASRKLGIFICPCRKTKTGIAPPSLFSQTLIYRLKRKKLKKHILLIGILSTVLFAQNDLEVVVTANKIQQNSKEVTSNIEVITKEEIEERHYKDVIEMLSKVSGISFRQSGSTGSLSSIFIRGMDNSRVLVLIDGVRYQNPSNTSGADFSHLHISNIERVEILKGSNSSIWGADAAAGVINIITKRAASGINADAAIEGGSYGSRKISATASIKEKGYYFNIAALKIEEEGFSSRSKKSKNREDYEKDGYENSTVNIKGGAEILESTSIDVSYTKIDAEKEYDGYITDPVTYAFDAVASANDDTMKSDIETTLSSLKLTHEISKHTIALSHSVSTFESKESGVTWGVDGLKGETTVTEFYDHINYIDSGVLLIGAKTERNEGEYKQVFGASDSFDYDSKGYFLSNQNSFNNLVFNQSIRYSDLEGFDDKTTAKVGVKYSFSRDLYLTSNYGTAYNAPNIINILNPWGASNFDIKPETANSFDFTFSYKKYSLTHFTQRVEDLLFWNDNGSLYDYSDDFYDNGSGTSKIKGFEIQGEESFPSISSLLTFNYNSLDAKNADGKDLAKRAKESAQISFDHYPNTALAMNLHADYIGERYDGVGKSGAQTGKYTLLGSVINYKINKNFTTYLKVDNLTDREYRVVDGYAAAGRSFYLGIKGVY